MLAKGAVAKPEDSVAPGDAIKDPYVLEFLDLKDEYSESDLEDALIRRLEDFLLELGEGFTFIGSAGCVSTRPGIGWTCCCSIAGCAAGHRRPEAGQPEPCGRGPDAHVLQLRWAYRAAPEWQLYALEGLPTKVMAANYRMVLPDAELLQKAGEHAGSNLARHFPTKNASHS